MVGIHSSCKNTLQELSMLAYDEKAEDDKLKLVKQNDHTWDADIYALTPHFGRYITMTWFNKHKQFKLFLTKDKRTGVNYNHFIGTVPFEPTAKSYIKKAELWDLLAQTYRYEEVVLKRVTVRLWEEIIEVEVANGLL